MMGTTRPIGNLCTAAKKKKILATLLKTDNIHSYDRRRLDNRSIKSCGVVVYYTLVNLQLFSYWNVTYFTC